jgi:hypothetical protein
MKSPSPTSTKVKYVGLDVHAETIAVAIAEGDEAVRVYGTIVTGRFKTSHFGADQNQPD